MKEKIHLALFAVFFAIVSSHAQYVQPDSSVVLSSPSTREEFVLQITPYTNTLNPEADPLRFPVTPSKRKKKVPESKPKRRADRRIWGL